MTAANWGLPALASGQAGPEVTVNAIADLLAAGAPAPVVQSVTLTAPPGSPAEFGLWGVPAGATGAWAGQGGKLARYHLAAWHFFAPPLPFRAFVADEGRECTLTAAGWLRGGAVGPWGSAGGYAIREALATTASGTSVAVPGLILDRDVVVGVAVRSMGVTGAASFDCGVPGELNKFGATLGVAAGATNRGVVPPTAYYADTNVVLTANGGAFTGGSVRLSAMVLTITPPGAA